MDNNKILAVVGGREITQNDVDSLLNNLDPQTAKQLDSEQGKQQLLEELINQELIYLDAIEQTLEKEAEYLQELKRLQDSFLKQYALNKLLNSISIEEGEALNYYNQNPSLFQEPESVKASHILVEDKETAEKVINELNEGLSFADAAKQYSSCPSKERGGDLGFFSKGRMVPEFEEAAFDLELNTLSEPVKSQFGHHIIIVTDKKDAGVSSFENVQDQIEQQLTQQRQHQVYTNKINSLKSKYDIDYLQ